MATTTTIWLHFICSSVTQRSTPQGMVYDLNLVIDPTNTANGVYFRGAPDMAITVFGSVLAGMVPGAPYAISFAY